MDIRFRFMAIVLLPALLSLPACSRDEPASEPAPAAARKAGQDQAKDAADEDVPDVSGDPRVMQNPTAEEPGFLTAFADASETIGTAPFEVKLNVDVVENTGTPPYSFVWDFGDATEFSTEKSPTHVYKIPGSFRASVIIRDSKGEVDQDYIDLSVSDPNAPAGLTAEQLMQQVPVEEILRQAREAAAKNAGAADGEQAGEGAEP
jgi:hypothetical protein